MPPLQRENRRTSTTVFLKICKLLSELTDGTAIETNNITERIKSKKHKIRNIKINDKYIR